MDYKSLAKKIFDITGPEENILHAANCMTRLRLQLAQAAPGRTAFLCRCRYLRQAGCP